MSAADPARIVSAVLTATARVERVGSWVTLKPVLIFHLITRVMMIGALVVAAGISDRTFPEIVLRWDGIWYERLATEGYPRELPTTPTGEVRSSTAAFFPLFPLLARGLMAFGLPFWSSAMIINLAASAAAVIMIVLAMSQYLDRRTAQLVGCLWSTFPVSVALTIAYSEAVFMVFGAAALFFMLRRDWVLAGIAAALAGTARPPGIVFVGAVGLAALIAVVRDREWRALIGAAIAPLGALGTLAGIGLYAGRLDAWHATERDGWHAKIDFGATWLTWFNPAPQDLHETVKLLTALLAVVLLGLVIATIWLRPPVPIIALVAVGTFMAFGYTGVGMHAAPRVMMTLFPILAPPAMLMARWRSHTQWVVLAGWAVCTTVLGAYFWVFAPLPL